MQSRCALQRHMSTPLGGYDGMETFVRRLVPRSQGGNPFTGRAGGRMLSNQRTRWSRK